mgnify:CR=1 FL=1
MVDKTENDSSDGFSPVWLTLREPADHAARSAALTQKLAAWAREQSALHILEMGCGTGSNLRYLCPHLGHHQEWTLLDYDPVLLAQLPLSIKEWAEDEGVDIDIASDIVTVEAKNFSARIRWQQADLANELDALPFETTQLVTGSALLDLTSQSWLQQLSELCIRHQCASLFVLNYDGRIQWQPERSFDTQTITLLNRHQLGDKGFGPAMGPLAGRTFAQALSSGQQCSVEPSDWQIIPEQQALQQALLDGWREACAELAPENADELERWHDERQRLITSLESSLCVGHTDILSLPFSDQTITS